MGDLITHETFLFYKARSQEDRNRREAVREHNRRLFQLMGYELDPIYEED